MRRVASCPTRNAPAWSRRRRTSGADLGHERAGVVDAARRQRDLHARGPSKALSPEPAPTIM